MHTLLEFALLVSLVATIITIVILWTKIENSNRRHRVELEEQFDSGFSRGWDSCYRGEIRMDPSLKNNSIRPKH